MTAVDCEELDVAASQSGGADGMRIDWVKNSDHFYRMLDTEDRASKTILRHKKSSLLLPINFT